LKAGGKIFGSTIQKIRPISEWKEASEESKGMANGGKLLLKI